MRFSKKDRITSDVNPYFCQDIWFEVFKELPVKTLGICRCVCKSWYSLVVSPSFMAAHLKHYTQNDANSLLLYKEIYVCSSTGRRHAQCVLFRDSSQLKQGNRLHTSVCPFVVPDYCFYASLFYFVGSINGLVCVYDFTVQPRDRILIWNPLLDKFVKLPQSPYIAEFYRIAFGYDFRKNDHRVIKISYYWFEEMPPPFVEVYSVQERTWRTICSKYLVDNSIDSFSSSNCFLNGVIHWHTRNKWLLLFNVIDETFAKMELPEEIMQNYPYIEFNYGVFEYQGMLSVSRCNFTSRDILVECNVWMKGDYNVENSWCKILSIDMLQKFCYIGPLEYLGKNEELIGLSEEWIGEVVSYDPKTKQITELGLPNSSSTTFRAYSPSLALLDLKIHDFTADELAWKVLKS